MSNDNEMVWLEDLIWCPSQIYYYFTDPLTDKCWVIYLRWRWDDPWSAELCQVLDDDKWIWPDDWLPLQREYGKDEYKELEEDCIRVISSMFPHINFK